MGAVARLEKRLKGQPDHVLTLALLLVAAALVVIALSNSTLLKAASAAWVLLP